MPQLDQVTFFSQFFWLFLIYIAFYLLLLKNFVPALSRIFKYRNKKITCSQQGDFGVKMERYQIIKTLDGIVERTANRLESLFQTNLEAIHFWLNNVFVEGKQTEWKEVNPIYLTYLAEKSLSRNGAVGLTLEKSSEAKFLPFLIEDLNKALAIQTIGKDDKDF